jgi:ATP-binding cassette, subfamily A (ABC1), member 3
MEEAEALCQRIGIMVAGRLRCLGTPQHLRSQYAQGYQLDVNLVTAEHESAEHPDAAHIQDVSSGADQARVSALRDWVKATWPGSVELEANDVNLKFRIPQSGTSGAAEISLSASPVPSSVRSVSIAEMFRTMEQHKQQLHIREYSVSETTLEQIFLYFANEGKRKKDKDTNN